MKTYFTLMTIALLAAGAGMGIEIDRTLFREELIGSVTGVYTIRPGQITVNVYGASSGPKATKCVILTGEPGQNARGQGGDGGNGGDGIACGNSIVILPGHGGSATKMPEL